MSLLGKLAILWDLFLSWLRNSPPGKLFNRPKLPRSEKTIPVEIHDNHIHLQAQANLARPLSMILDTGADYNGLNTALSAELGIKHKIELKLGGAGTGEDTTAIAFTRTIRLDLSGIQLHANLFAPLSKMEAGIGRPIDGIIGAELFQHCVVEIDYHAQTLTLHHAQTYRATGKGEIIPIQLEGHRPFIQARIKVSGMEAIEGKFIIDIGDSSGLSLHTPFVQKYDLLSYIRNVIPHFTSGIAGEAREFLGRVDSLQIGDFILDRPIVALSQAEKGSTADKSYDGAIGGEILRRFKVVLDYSRRQVYLERNADFDTPFEVDMSGMVLVGNGQKFATIKIDRIYENTPASEIGLREGDILHEINGESLDKLGLERLKQMFKLDGKEYDLSIQRNEQPLNLKLTTRRLV